MGRCLLAAGPSVVVVRDGALFDVTSRFPTVSELLNGSDPVADLMDSLPGSPAVALQKVLESASATA